MIYVENNLILKEFKDFNLMENTYDSIRLVNPLGKKVFSYLKGVNGEVPESNEACYGFWTRNTSCDNCISMRAYNQKRSIIKIEFKDEKIYMIMAAPIENDSQIMVIELLKDITNDGIFDIEEMGSVDINRLINKRNASAIKDSLTKIFNEQYIYERLPYDILISKEKNTNIALLLIKIKNLEVINNTYGYKEGDIVLKEIAKVLKLFPRLVNDWVSRYHGLEFVMVMHKVDENQIKRICKRIEDKVNQIEFKHNGEKMSLLLNIGYHIIRNETITPEQFIANACNMSYLSDKETQEGYTGKINSKILSLMTDREKEVALVLLEGKSNIEISQELFIGLSTVKKHISSIFKKTEVKSRGDFFAKARL